MIKYLKILSCCWLLLCFNDWSGLTQCRANVLFVHDYKTKEYVMGEHEALVHIAVTANEMFIDRQVHYSGSWMKRFFGRVTESRSTTKFLLEQAEIHEIDWKNGRIKVYPFAGFTDVSLYKQELKNQEQIDEMLKARYKVMEPVLSITVHAEPEIIAEYSCRKIDANLRLETRDLIKKSSSVTLINQTLWVSDEVPGVSAYEGFYRKMGEQLGLEAQRLGNLSFLLRYWNAPLENIKEELLMVSGYPVKRISTVEARYKADIESAKPRITSSIIKEESLLLQKVVLDNVDINMFIPPDTFRIN